MAAPMKTSKSEKKCLKKQLKHKQNLMRRENITCTDVPTAILCVSNGGLDNGVTYEEMLDLFQCHGDHCDVIMLPKKPYSFVCFSNVTEGEAAMTALNGHHLPMTEKRTAEIVLYLSYVSEVPQSVAASSRLPPGLILLEEFISAEYAQQILESINWEDESATTAGASVRQELKHRRVKHYGYEFKYTINNVDPDDPLPEGIPAVYKPLLDKVMDERLVKHFPDQLTINQYQPGQGIPAHVDTPSAFEDGLMSLSLGSQVLMEFRHPDGQHLSVLLPPRSLLVMTGESRYIWSHGITPRKSDIVSVPGGGLTLSHRGIRTSFTFRKITGVKPEDLELNQPDVPVSEDAAAKLEKLHVHKVYNEIASHFSGTRHTPWPNIVEFLNQQPAGSMLADIGCGNGKYFGINKQLYEIGSDRSSNLAEICNGRKFQVFVGDVLSIPLREGLFDVCLCIAVIHHLSTQERRQRAVMELLKILRPGGKALIYVWAMEQEVNKVKSKYLKDSKQHARCSSMAECDMEHNVAGKGEHLIDCHRETISNNFGDTGGGYDNVQDMLKDQTDGSSEVNIMGRGHSDSISSRSVDSTDTELRYKVNLEANKMAVERCVDNSAKAICDHETDICHNATYDSEDAISKTPKKLEVHVNRTEFKQQDLLVPWQLKKEKAKDGQTFHRFYHVFEKGEIEELCSRIGCCKVEHSYYDQGNWAVILEKL